MSPAPSHKGQLEWKRIQVICKKQSLLTRRLIVNKIRYSVRFWFLLLVIFWKFVPIMFHNRLRHFELWEYLSACLMCFISILYHVNVYRTYHSEPKNTIFKRNRSLYYVMGKSQTKTFCEEDSAFIEQWYLVSQVKRKIYVSCIIFAGINFCGVKTCVFVWIFLRELVKKKSHFHE